MQTLLDQYDTLLARYFQLKGWPMNDTACEILNCHSLDEALAILERMYG